MSSSHALFADHALLPTGWARDVLFTWDAHGRYTHIAPNAACPPDAIRAAGPVLPGITNLHSHAFQRTFAGLTEYRAEAADSFWSWRTLMYGFANAISPEQVEAVATYLYGEMLAAGYTSVCEFHYLHHDPDGHPYLDDALLAQALLRAAHNTGIHLTLLPVLYQASGFGGAPLSTGQRRFGHHVDSMQRLLERLAPLCASQDARLGLAPHSLRAVTPDALKAALAMLDTLDPTAPVHIHIAEQTREVDDCVAFCGQRPVEWLVDHTDLSARWCLVHATHMTPLEARRAAATGAIAGLCPSTEANLGDGIFDMASWIDGQGRWGVGSDSHACVNAAEELQLLEYSQRWATRQRNVLATPAHPHVAEAMTHAAVAGGAQAAGRASSGLQQGLQQGGLQVGAAADWVVLDAQHPALAGLAPADMLSGHVFGSHRTSAIAEVWTRGTQRVSGGRHHRHDADVSGFVKARAALLASMGR
ncbi:formimidoylglutamate deiminase [Alcaligenaceae bacterium C4P045]|nr:formimidoylglutamate deiminase [Alcaligenaceae bacterium C4P045]